MAKVWMTLPNIKIWGTFNLFKYKATKNKVTKIIAQSKYDFYISSVEDAQGYQKQPFKMINRLLQRKRSSKLPDIELAKLPNMFSDFFATKIRKNCDNLSKQILVRTHTIGMVVQNYLTLSMTQSRKLVLSSSNNQCLLVPIPTWLVK